MHVPTGEKKLRFSDSFVRLFVSHAEIFCGRKKIAEKLVTIHYPMQLCELCEFSCEL